MYIWYSAFKKSFVSHWYIEVEKTHSGEYRCTIRGYKNVATLFWAEENIK